MAITFEDLQELTDKQKQQISSYLLLNEKPTSKQESTFGSMVGQFALGAFNSALLGLPQFLIDRKGEGAFAEEDTTSERVARGAGSLVGFVLGAPAKIFAKGAQIGGKLAIKGASKVGIRSAKAGKVIKGVGKGAGGFGAIEAAELPTGEETVLDKAITVPTAIGLGAALGVAEPIIAKAIGPHLKKAGEAIKNRNGRQYEDALSALTGETVRTVKNLDKTVIKALDSKQFSVANDIINTSYAGAKKAIARTRLTMANSKALANKPEYQKILRSGDVASIAEAELKNIIPKGKNLAKEAFIVSTDAIKNISKAVTRNRAVSSTRARLTEQGGSSKEMGKMIDTVRNEYEVLGGNKLVKAELITSNLTKKQKQNVVDLLDGRVTVAVDKTAANAFKEIDATIFQDVANRAKGMVNVSSKEKGQIIREFFARKRYFPHMIPSIDSPKKVVNEFIDTAVKQGRVKNHKEGQQIWDAFVNASVNRSEKGIDAFAKYLMRTGQARNIGEAKTKAISFAKRQSSPKFGNLESARDINFPIYDNNLDRVLARYIMGSEQRLAEIKHFGHGNKNLLKLVEGVRNEGQDVVVAEELFKRVTGSLEQENIMRGLLTPSQASSIRSFQVVTKLGLASIPNSTQSINTAMATSVKDTIVSLRKYLSSSGNRAIMEQHAKRGGIALETGMSEYLKGLGLDGSFKIGSLRVSASTFLKMTRFVWLEKMNRVVAYHAGQSYAANTARQLVDNPRNRLARSALKRMGISPQKALSKNGLDGDDLIKAGRYISDKTQFRAGPLDLPLWMTSPEGKLLAQFKTFGFNQAKFIKDALKEEVSRGNYKPIATAVVAMPILGEGVKNIRGVLSGQERDSEGLERVLDNISAVGAAGLLNDIWASAKFNNIEGALLGPTGSDLSKLVEGTQRAIEGRPKSLQRLALRNIPVVGPRLQNEFVPSNKLRRLREKRKREREKLRGKD